MVTIVSSEDPWQWTSDELRQNFISDEMQLHTSTLSELNLIKSVIYIYIGNLFLYFKQNFIINDELNNINLIFVIYEVN